MSGEATLHTWVQRSQDWDWKDRSFRRRSLFTAALRSTGRTSGAAHAHKRLGRDHHPSPAAQLDASSNDDAQPHDPTEGIIVHEVGAWADMSELLTDGCTPPPPSGGGGGSGDSEDPHHLSVDMGNGISVATFGTFSEAKDFANDEGRGVRQNGKRRGSESGQMMERPVTSYVVDGWTLMVPSIPQLAFQGYG